MGRKSLADLCIRVKDEKVYLSFYISDSVFYRDGENDIHPRFKVYRKIENEFEFNVDYGEYFDCISHERAEKIFEGELPVYNGRKIIFCDNAVEIGKTYAYWVSTDKDGELPVGPVAVKVRDNEVWWPWKKVEERMRILEERNPNLVKIKQYGSTTGNTPLMGITAGNPDNCIAMVGTVHAGESGPELVIPIIERLLDSDGDILSKAGIAALPSVNVDVRERLVEGVPYYLRTNVNGVDLNRNFNAKWNEIGYGYGLDTSDPDSDTYRGPFPESERETQAVVGFIDETKPRVVFSMHCLASICGDSFLMAREAENDPAYCDESMKLMAAYTEGFRDGVDTALKKYFTCSSGSLPAWVYSRYGIPCFDLECDSDEESKACFSDRTTKGLIERYQDRHYNGIRRVLRTLC